MATMRYDRSNVFGYMKRVGGEVDFVPTKTQWDAPCASVALVPRDPFWAHQTIYAWLAYPSEASKRGDAIAAVEADAAHWQWHEGLIGQHEIPDCARADRQPKALRERRSAAVIAKAHQRLRDAHAILPPLIKAHPAFGATKATLNKIIEIDLKDDNAHKRRWRPLRPVAHLAYALMQRFAVNSADERPLGFPDGEAEVVRLLEIAETARKFLAVVIEPSIPLESSVQFRPRG